MRSRSTTSDWAPLLVRVLIPAALGALGLFLSAQAPPASTGFYVATFATAAIWFVTWWLYGARVDVRGSVSREMGRGVVIGAALIALFIVGALVVRSIPVLAGPVDELLDNMRTGAVLVTLLTLVVNGIGEELFFRDVAQRELEKRLARWGATIAQVGLYMVVTAAMGVPLLLVAALLVGVCATWESSRSGNLISAITLHLTWSVGMAFLLPLLIH
ncbi:CPBP family intramembrane glutamic endopeptidase [Corynebacterium cystitidis]|uniref:CPBP family intramembrane glutamic endopeptidase n=1 Tax=Corynebacterium cystitidis TaxID=35757 RepID=UPI00211F0C30|nr:CPBP family intramembrane glutamic endopeptidase [Corynebacterium cystitidis]